MSNIPMSIPVSAFGVIGARIIRGLGASDEPVLLTERGEVSAVFMSIDAYRRSEATRELLLALAMGERDIAAGRVFSLDEAMAEIDAMLDETELRHESP